MCCMRLTVILNTSQLCSVHVCSQLCEFQHGSDRNNTEINNTEICANRTSHAILCAAQRLASTQQHLGLFLLPASLEYGQRALLKATLNRHLARAPSVAVERAEPAAIHSQQRASASIVCPPAAAACSGVVSWKSSFSDPPPRALCSLPRPLHGSMPRLLARSTRMSARPVLPAPDATRSARRSAAPPTPTLTPSSPSLSSI